MGKATVRRLSLDELGELMNMLEVSYNYPKGFFQRHYPYLYRPECAGDSIFLVVDVDGRIVSHVGLFKMKARVFGVEVDVGGIGGVATLPSERGRGYMSMLLNHAVRLMADEGIPLSVLWGDRHRYGAFGWEVAGLKYVLYLTERAIARGGVKPIELTKADWGSVDFLKRQYGSLPLSVERRWECYGDGFSMDPMTIGSGEAEIWVSEHGYIIAQPPSNQPHKPDIVEVASADGLEAELIAGYMKVKGLRRALIHVNSQDPRLPRILKASSYYTAMPEASFRINSLYGFLKPFEGLLGVRAEEHGLKDYEASLGLSLGGNVDYATIYVRGGSVSIVRGAEGRDVVVMDERDGVRLLLGGPMATIPRALKPLSTILPIPIHIPLLNYV